jgi:hypothetical protein
MITREQAIMIINQYSTKEGTFVFNYSFPSSLVPKDLKMERWLFLSALDVEQDELSYAIQDVIYDQLLSSDIIKREWNYIEYRNKDHLVNIIETIKYLENYQNQFDELQKKDEADLNETIDLINRIKKIEYKLIDEAEILLKIKENIETCVVEWGKKISDKNNWEGE